MPTSTRKLATVAPLKNEPDRPTPVGNGNCAPQNYATSIKSCPLCNLVESGDVILGLDWFGSRDLGLEQSSRLEGHLNVLSPLPPPRQPLSLPRTSFYANSSHSISRERRNPGVLRTRFALRLPDSPRFFDWQNAITIVKPDTLIRWHRKGFCLFWKWKSRPRGRPRIPADLQKLIAEMAVNNPTGDEERIADELLLKMGIRISPRTIRRYIPQKPRRPPDPSQPLDDLRPQPCQGRHLQ